jgi:ChaB
MPTRRELPDTTARSRKKAQRTSLQAHDSAVETYGEGERAHWTAFAALKHSFDGRARRGGRTSGGVDVLGSTRDELYERARKLGVRGRSRMRKEELARASVRKQR